jgi:hypothetical protein
MPPFTVARQPGRNQMRDCFAPLMEQAQSEDPKIWFGARIAQLRREVAHLAAELGRS